MSPEAQAQPANPPVPLTSRDMGALVTLLLGLFEAIEAFPSAIGVDLDAENPVIEAWYGGVPTIQARVTPIERRFGQRNPVALVVISARHPGGEWRDMGGLAYTSGRFIASQDKRARVFSNLKTWAHGEKDTPNDVPGDPLRDAALRR